MHSINKIENIISGIKEHFTDLSASEKEALRDELLAFVLFNKFREDKSETAHTNKSFQSLTTAEKELIKKLADQTDKLFRLNSNPE